MKKLIAAIVVSVLSFICILVSMFYYLDLCNQYMSDKNYAFVCVEQSEYYDLSNEEYVRGTYYVEENQIAEENNIHKKVNTSLIIVDFSLNDMFGIGTELLEFDENGCIISSVLADELFGSNDVIGLSVTVKNKNYSVRSVFFANDKMIILHCEKKVDGDWALIGSKEVSGIVLDVSDEMYRGQYVEKFCSNHGFDYNYYYVSDYINIFPDSDLPAKLSDFEKWSTMMEEWKDISDRKNYHREDVVETFYYRIGNKLQRYRIIILISSILFITCCIKFVFIYRKQKKKSYS